EISADNADRALKPYMTANVSFQVARKDDALLVPNVALRWSPTDPELIAPEARAEMAAETSRGGGTRRGAGGAGAGGGTGGGTSAGTERRAESSATTQPHRAEGAAADQKRGTIWIEDGNYVRPIKLRLGVTDTVNTEVVSGDLKEGQQVIIGEAAAAGASSEQARNPFAPQFRGRR